MRIHVGHFGGQPTMSSNEAISVRSTLLATCLSWVVIVGNLVSRA
ncbi:MAG: hypothetical protein R2932_11245 [Caldilineaceae bacterium]